MQAYYASRVGDTAKMMILLRLALHAVCHLLHINGMVCASHESYHDSLWAWKIPYTGKFSLMQNSWSCHPTHQKKFVVKFHTCSLVGTHPPSAHVHVMHKVLHWNILISWQPSIHENWNFAPCKIFHIIVGMARNFLLFLTNRYFPSRSHVIVCLSTQYNYNNIISGYSWRFI